MALTRRAADTGPDSRKAIRPFRVLALDPGGTTGWAYAEWALDDVEGDYQSIITHPNQITWESGQIGPHEHHKELWSLLLEYWQVVSYGPAFQIVCESFEFRQHIDKEHAKTKVELISKEYIGLVKLFYSIYHRPGDVEEPIDPIVFNTASAAKALCPDKGPEANVKLKQLGLYKPANPHANDATRHLLRFLFVNLRIKEPFASIWLGEKVI